MPRVPLVVFMAVLRNRRVTTACWLDMVCQRLVSNVRLCLVGCTFHASPRLASFLWMERALQYVSLDGTDGTGVTIHGLFYFTFTSMEGLGTCTCMHLRFSDSPNRYSKGAVLRTTLDQRDGNCGGRKEMLLTCHLAGVSALSVCGVVGSRV